MIFLCCLITLMTTFVLLRSDLEATIPGSTASYDEQSTGLDIDKLLEADSIIRSEFIGDIDYDYVMQCILDGYMFALSDRYSAYHTQEEMDALTMESNGNFVGIGVRVFQDTETGGILILNVMDDSPALKAGLQVGDVIIKVDDLEVNDETYTAAVNNVAGEEGTSLTLTVKRGDEVFTKTLTRALVDSEAVFSETLDNGITLIRIYEFTGNAADDFIKAVDEALEKGTAGFIFDVRNNPGGDLNIIVKILDRLLPAGPIVNILASSEAVVYTYESDERRIDKPIVVLTNGNTASAAELFTAALKDYGMCSTVGETTYGKGVMQTIYRLSDGSGLRITTHYYNPPFSANYDGVGIPADYAVKMDAYLIADRDSDIQLEKAISVVTGN